MPSPKPRPPRQSELEREAIAELQKLGVKYDPRSSADKVYDFLVEYWQKHHRPPRNTEIGKALNLKQVHHILRSLETEGRILKAHKGLWIPKT